MAERFVPIRLPPLHKMDCLLIFLLGRIVDAKAIGNFLHVLTVGPFELHTFDLSGSAIKYGSIKLTTRIVSYWGDEHFHPPPVMTVLQESNIVVIYEIHFDVCIIIEGATHRTHVLSMHLDPKRIKHNSYLDIDSSVGVSVVAGTGTLEGMVLLNLQGHSRLHILDVTRESSPEKGFVVASLDLPHGFRLHRSQQAFPLPTTSGDNMASLLLTDTKGAQQFCKIILGNTRLDSIQGFSLRPLSYHIG